MDTLRQRVGKRLEHYRKLARLPREALADKVDLEPQTLRNYEKGTRWPDPERLETIAEALGVSPEQLILGPDAIPTDRYDREAREWDDAQRRLETENAALKTALRSVLTDDERAILESVRKLDPASLVLFRSISEVLATFDRMQLNDVLGTLQLVRKGYDREAVQKARVKRPPAELSEKATPRRRSGKTD